MAKISKEVPNPGAGGSYLFDPKTGKLTLITKSPAPTDNGTNSEEVSDCEGGVDVRD
jgi:hypothetical protein